MAPWLTRITPPGPVEARSPEPPDGDYSENDEKHDFEHGHHVETPSPEANPRYAQLDTLERFIEG